MLELPAAGAPALPAVPWALEVPDVLGVGMMESDIAPSNAAGAESAASIVGRTLRFSRADSF